MDASASHAADAGQVPSEIPLTQAQAHVLAEIVHSGRSANPPLRYAVIPVEELEGLDAGPLAVGVSNRAQHYLRRAISEWALRGLDTSDLLAAGRLIAAELGRLELHELAARAKRLAELEPAAFLLEALELDRALVGECRKSAAVWAFSASLEHVLAAIAQKMPPTPLEQMDVARVRRAAREEFICAHLPLVRMRACMVRHSSALPLDDLVQIGSVALIQAVDLFDPRYGVPFGAYAYPWIKQRIRRGEGEAAMISLPERLREARRKVYKFLADPLNADATPAYIADRLNLTPAIVERVLRERQDCLSLDTSEQRALVDTCPDDKQVALEEHVRLRERREAVQKALATSAERERDILQRIYGIGREAEPVSVIAKSHSLTTQRIYQIRDAEIRRLRRPAVSQQLAEYL